MKSTAVPVRTPQVSRKQKVKSRIKGKESISGILARGQEYRNQNTVFQ